MNDPVVIVGAARTPMGAFQGDFSSKSANDLGAVAIAAAVERAKLDPKLVEHVYMGNCLMAGQGQAPARQAAIKGGLPLSAGAVTLSKMCGAAMQATIFAHDSIVAGSADIGAHCTVGGGAVVLGHLSLANGVHISAASVVTRSIRVPGHYTGMFPIDDNARWEKNAASVKQLHRLRERLRALEQVLAQTNKNIPAP